MVRFVLLVATLALALGACQSNGEPGKAQPPRFGGAIEPIAAPIEVHPKAFPPSPARILRTITARDGKTGEIVDISGRIFSTVRGDKSGADVVVTTTIDRFDGYHRNQPNMYAPGTKIRFVYGDGGRLGGMRIQGPSGAAIGDSEQAKLLQITFRQGIDVARVVTGTRVLIAEFEFPGMPGRMVQTDGVVKGKAVFKTRPVAVVEYHGTVSGADRTAEMDGYFLVDLETWMVIYSDWRTLTPLRQGGGVAHIREVAELMLGR
jgi:hypothetical protein